MLATQEPVLRRFWYPVIPIEHLLNGPQSFTLLGQPLVLWLNADGEPVALADRCCHRSAKLSLGIVQNGCVRCPYHGWEFDGAGTCTRVPQLDPGTAIPKTYRVPSYHCQERYGYVWVCLEDEPLLPLPEIPEATIEGHRLIPQFYEVWNCSGLRLMENSFDNAHLSFVHAASFGMEEQPKPARSELVPQELGLKVYSTIPVVNPPAQQQNLNIPDSLTVRHIESTWYPPFIRTLKITYPNGLLHMIFTAATPISDSASQIVQFCIRNDSEAEASAESIVAFDRQVVEEDKIVLESTDYDTPLDLSVEQHMSSDQPGILMRRQLAALIKSHAQVQENGRSLNRV
ncbi:MAG: aromatic ring-hydroxylating dioxygenase subunit alpha [Synechococcales cyanobacterium C42_A2020_086]|jgi:phenylpropionate dioxygenase-like ring-hydroxylating dioxygenase large terminal subunit|nr:aromatic ring-hydroxylating dioxygenase subunit alpha [Synechococcales cyanobacterium M58_A2018_015]MBF2073990.1 aromatic ring-hydroxylating dioxygenase subunit alpha [Synechococcales cyanobacterium C42_A2020_086]